MLTKTALSHAFLVSFELSDAKKQRTTRQTLLESIWRTLRQTPSLPLTHAENVAGKSSLQLGFSGNRVRRLLPRHFRQVLSRWMRYRQNHADACRYYLRQLTRKPMTKEALSIDPSGTWSWRQAKAVLDVINPQAISHGIFFHPLEVTTHAHAYRHYILVAYCIEHDCAVMIDEVCAECLYHVHRRI